MSENQIHYVFPICPVVPFCTENGEFDSEKQLAKIDEEYNEVQRAFSHYQNHPDGKNRAHLAEELADLMTSCATFLTGLDSSDDVEDIFRMVYLKNKTRGYFKKAEN